jgi:hypothetical protein
VGANAYGNCACNSPGPCKTACADSYCKGKQPQQGDACYTCLEQQGQGECGDASAQACHADPECVAFARCLAQAGCESLQ